MPPVLTHTLRFLYKVINFDKKKLENLGSITTFVELFIFKFSMSSFVSGLRNLQYNESRKFLPSLFCERRYTLNIWNLEF